MEAIGRWSEPMSSSVVTWLALPIFMVIFMSSVSRLPDESVRVYSSGVVRYAFLCSLSEVCIYPMLLVSMQPQSVFGIQVAHYDCWLLCLH